MRGLTVSGSHARSHVLAMWVLLFPVAFRVFQTSVNGSSSQRPVMQSNMVFNTVAQTDIADANKLSSSHHTITAQAGNDIPAPTNFAITFSTTTN